MTNKKKYNTYNLKPNNKTTSTDFKCKNKKSIKKQAICITKHKSVKNAYRISK